MDTSKTENGIRYTLTKNSDTGLTEPSHYWTAADGSRLDLTPEETEELDRTRSITD